MLLTVNKLKKSFAENLIFENVSFGIDEHDKIGFIGTNGAGKSTLIKILTGELQADEGDIFKNKSLKIGYLDQYSCNNSNKTVYDEALDVFSHLISMENELEDIRFQIEGQSGNIEILIEKQHTLTEKFQNEGGYLYKNKTRAFLLGLGFTEDDLKLNVCNLSGGQKTRVSLVKILLSDANLLLLDEPTNHLDIESVEWLEDFLKGYNGAFIIISHDRYFLDRVTNRTFELECQKFHSLNLKYSEYQDQRDIEKLTEERNYENTVREIERLEKIVEQQRRWNREKNIKTAESKLKVIKKLEETLVKPSAEERETKFRFKALSGGGNDVLKGTDLSMSFPQKSLFSNVDFHITKGEKIFILGPNGCGKSTLLKIIMGNIKPSGGSVKIGENILFGYYDQLQEGLNMDKTILDEVWDEYPKLTQTQVRNAIATFLFTGEDVFKVIKTLSGGERARVELVKLILKSVNLLIMDEPTNHLDIKSREALERALSEYDGTIIMVSHDRYFINSLATRILYLNESGITSFNGNYEEYIEKRNVIIKDSKTQKAPTESKLSYEETKKLESEKRKLQTKFKKIENEIFSIEAEIDKLNAELNEPQIATDFEKASEITRILANKTNRLDNLYKEWEEIQIKMEK